MSTTSVRDRRVKRQRDHFRAGARRETCYICGANGNYGGSIIHHHTSYWPEETVPLCNSCHAKLEIHGQYPELEAPRSRPDDYHRKREESSLAPCSICDEWQVETELFEFPTTLELLCYECVTDSGRCSECRKHTRDGWVFPTTDSVVCPDCLEVGES